MKIGNFDLKQKIFVVAEIGNNHEGNFQLAEKMIHAAAKAGADAVKFQTIIPARLVSPREKERIQQLERFRFSYEQFEKLNEIAKSARVLFLSTPFDVESVHFLNRFVPAFKIASGDNNFFPLIEVIAKTGKPIILSSGLADFNDVAKTKSFIEGVWNQENIEQELAILHCVVSYPTQPKDANLLAIRELQKFGVTVGYSDHTIGIDAAVLSVALGARIIEKHFTIDKNYSTFHDHKLSADPDEFCEMVKKIKESVELLGDGTKRVQETERKMIEKARRAIVSNRDLGKGTVIQREDLDWVRPGIGLFPGEEGKIIGKKLKRPLLVGEPILLSDVE